MDLQDSFVDDLIQAEDEYEVMALCYNKLLEYTRDTDVLFVAKIEHLESDVELNSFAQTFEELRQTIISYSEEINVHFGSDGTGFDTFKDRLIIALSSFPCPKEINIGRWLSICLFYVLEALDSYIDKNLASVRSNYRTFGPLNRGRSKTCCLVYLHERESFLSAAYAEGYDGFRRPLRNTRIGSLFHAVLLIPYQQDSIVPQITPVFLDDHCKQVLNERKAVKIASVPYIGFDTFSFHELTKIDPCAPGEMPDGPFYIDYDKEEDNVQRVIVLLQSAINGNANIIVFPEFIMSPKMFNGIKNYLKKLGSAQKSDLFLVLAGTSYEWESEKGNNILHILNANGVEIGSYYKHSPFLIQAEEKIHGALFHPPKSPDLQAQPEQETKLHKQRRYLGNCEILSDPGKKCTLIDVDVVGRILPAICRDVIDGRTESLANLFVPSFLMVPAWSQSITSFDTRFLTLANTIHTVSLLCNCCNAVKGTDKKVTGKIAVPQKRGTKMDALLQEITRDKDCTHFCQNHGGCVVQVEISFAKSNPQVSLNTVFPK